VDRVGFFLDINKSLVHKIHLYNKDQQDALFIFSFILINNLYMFQSGLLHIIRRYSKGKAISLKAGPGVSRRLSLPDFKTIGT
jgi:hypothetical protein